MNIILASNSPRRKQLLKTILSNFTVIPSDYEEDKSLDLPPEKYAELLAYNKAKSVFDKCGNIVIGADTIVVLGTKILGKPQNEEDAVKMLKSLSGKTHEVITGYAVISKDKTVKGFETTLVTFNVLSDELIKNYVKTGSPLDKAGAYGIQDGVLLVKQIQGDYNNVVGLPIDAINKILTNDFNYAFLRR